ncbi:MAG: hypothetical protein OEL91_10120, partial [Burkholderiaceae bacterium]|nr:hypothetical protein [Burkholderiaceae bacterium]
MPFKTDQEAFWAGDFGTEYIARNANSQLLASNLHFFAHALKAAGRVESCVEFGANIGMNLRALKLLYPELALKGVEINPDAAKQLTEFLGATQTFHGSIFDYPNSEKVDL